MEKYFIEKPGYDETDTEIKYRVRNPKLFEDNSFRTKKLPNTEGISMIIGKLKSDSNPKPMVVQALRFKKEEGWNIDKAKEWVKNHRAIVKYNYKLQENYELKLYEEEKYDKDHDLIDINKNKDINNKDEECNFNVPIVKMDNLNRIVYGVVYEPDVVDSQRHFMKSSEVQKMAWRFMRAIQTGHAGIDYMHNSEDGSGVVVESYIARKDEYEGENMLWKKGSWVLATQITDDDIWKKVLEGQITAYSIAGHAEFGMTYQAKSGDTVDISIGIPEYEV